MRNDALFTSCEWDTSVLDTNGQTYNLHGCMTLCDSGYHRWQETMCSMKYPTSVNDARFSSRFGYSLFLSPPLPVYALFAFLLLCVGRQV